MSLIYIERVSALFNDFIYIAYSCCSAISAHFANIKPDCRWLWLFEHFDNLYIAISVFIVLAKQIKILPQSLSKGVTAKYTPLIRV